MPAAPPGGSLHTGRAAAPTCAWLAWVGPHMLPMPPEVLEKSSAMLAMHASCRMCSEQGLVDWTAVIGTVGHV